MSDVIAEVERMADEILEAEEARERRRIQEKKRAANPVTINQLLAEVYREKQEDPTT
jgi:hypothetical protein